jgi:hypothetical protein
MCRISLQTDHTFNRLRSNSPFLLSTIICFAARFSESYSNLYPRLFAHTKLLLAKALAAGTCNISTIQSLACFIFWSLPWEGKQTWQRIGHATRLAYQLKMHIPRTRDLPEDQIEARSILVSLSSLSSDFGRRILMRFGLISFAG